MEKFDYVVIGTGAGLMIAETAALNGKKCAIIEKNKFGGTCLTKGCIPSKMLVYPADMIREAEKSNRVGLSFQPPAVDWNKISKRIWKQINFSEIIEENFKKQNNITIFKGSGEFTSVNTMKVSFSDGTYSDEFEGDVFIIANGAKSFVPPIKHIEQTDYLIPESFFGDKFPQKPWKSLIIIGGGAIGAEFAHIFSAFGTKVTIVEMRDRLLATEEEEISKFVATEFEKNNINVLTNTAIIDAGTNKSLKILNIENVITKEKTTIEADAIFIASGVASNSNSLKLENTDVEIDSRGWIKTNQYLETTQKNVYAIGDINGKYQFRHKANYEAQILMNNLFSNDKKRAACYNAVPWAIFSWPQIAHVGLTESQAKKEGLNYWIGRNYFSQIAGGIAMGINKNSTDNGFIKIIVGEDKTILGVHVVGPHAAILLQPFVYLMNVKHKCEKQNLKKCNNTICPQLGNYLPINDSMIIHPSLNELTAWVLENINWK